MNPHAYLFVDGSSSARNDIGAWAAVAIMPSGQRKLLYGMAYPTTISRCELIPIIEGLRWIGKEWSNGVGFRVTVYSDSEYTVKTLCGLYARRKNNDLWIGLDEVAMRMVVTYKWRERNSLPHMELCDWICTAIRKNCYKMADEWFGKDNILKPEVAIPPELLIDDK